MRYRLIVEMEFKPTNPGILPDEVEGLTPGVEEALSARLAAWLQQMVVTGLGDRVEVELEKSGVAIQRLEDPQPIECPDC